MVSVITTATVDAERVAQRRPQPRGAGVRVDRQQREFVAAPTLDPSTPAAACTRPSAFSVISVRPLRASTRTASASISLRRSASRSSGSSGAATIRPSHLDTTLLVTTTTSPSRSQGAAAASAAARSSPGPELGQPGDGQDLDRAGGAVLDGVATAQPTTPATSRPARTIAAVASGRSSAAARDRTATPWMSARVAGRATSQPSRSPPLGAGAVVPADRLGGGRPRRSRTGTHRPCRATGFPPMIGE